MTPCIPSEYPGADNIYPPPNQSQLKNAESTQVLPRHTAGIFSCFLSVKWYSCGNGSVTPAKRAAHHQGDPKRRASSSNHTLEPTQTQRAPTQTQHATSCQPATHASVQTHDTCTSKQVHMHYKQSEPGYCCTFSIVYCPCPAATISIV
jgi:hypothetical protein